MNRALLFFLIFVSISLSTQKTIKCGDDLKVDLCRSLSTEKDGEVIEYVKACSKGKECRGGP